MILLMMRHGIAVERGTGGVPDADRALTPEGVRKTDRAAAGLLTLGFRPDLVLTSPLLRARQTAERVATVLGCEAPEIGEDLAPGGDAAAFLARFRRRKPSCVMAVGHMPDLAIWTSVFLCGSREADIVLKKAAVCCLEFPRRPAEGAARLRWLLEPGQLRALAKVK